MATRNQITVNGKAVQAGTTATWEGLIATFIATQDVKESSRQLYTRTLTQFFKWVEDTGRLVKDLERKDVLTYKDELLAHGLSSLTVGSYIVSVRKLYEWAEAEGLYRNIAKGIKTPKRVQAFKKQHLTDNKSHELLEHFQNMSLRDYAIVNLILRTGLRTITFRGERRILRIWGKGRNEKDDFVVLSDKAYLPIANYLATRKGAKAGEPLFTSCSRQNRGERLTTRTISGLCKEGLRAIGMDGREFSAHSLRHTTAVAILKHGGNITDVQEVLRHASPVTSQIYTESVKEEMRLQNAPEMMLDYAF